MIIKEKDVLSDESLGGQTSDKTNSHKEIPYEYTNYKPTLFNNSLTANIQGKICNCLGCNELADTEITLKIAEKSLNILVCKNCKPKFET